MTFQRTIWQCVGFNDPSLFSLDNAGTAKAVPALFSVYKQMGLS